MNLYLLRHAHALDRDEAGVESDEERPLSDQGRQQAALLADALNRLGLSFDLVLTSPLRRAVETANELVPHLDTRPPVTELEPLAPGWSSKKLAKHLRALEAEQVVLVGHEPDLSQHAAWLIGSKWAQIELAKGALACITCDGLPRKGAGTLAWLVTPKLLAGLLGEKRGVRSKTE